MQISVVGVQKKAGEKSTTIVFFNIISAVVAKRHTVFWNSTNTRLTAGDLSVQLNFNDYLDIHCPHYPNEEAVGHGQPETLALYLVGEESFQGCVETRGAIKRWECNTPFAPYGPVRFSEKIQRFTPFSLGFEFLPGRHYYYSSLPTDEGPPLPCMKLRVTVCCAPSEYTPLFILTPRHKHPLIPSLSLPPFSLCLTLFQSFQPSFFFFFFFIGGLMALHCHHMAIIFH
uniref:Ephrin RBD domain-containing protein n=1 Tax=Neolamprologus brichardi TaxID=32507 RepID=A0A3Q4GC45_NEOBR